MTSAAAASPIARRLNLPFFLTLALLAGAYVVALYILRAVIADPEVAGSLAALVLGAGPWLQQRIEERVRRPAATVVSLDGYRIRWWLIVVAGAAVIWLSESARVYVELRAGPITAVAANISTVLTLLPVAAALGVGLLAGGRSDRFAFVVAVAAIVAGHLLAVATSDSVATFATGSAPPPGITTPPDLPPDPRPGLIGEGAGAFLLDDQAPLLVLVGMAGLWWGSRMQLGFYLGHLAAGLDPRSRAALVEIAEQEARSRGAGGPSA